jgi:hypothetical protein
MVSASRFTSDEVHSGGSPLNDIKGRICPAASGHFFFSLLRQLSKLRTLQLCSPSAPSLLYTFIGGYHGCRILRVESENAGLQNVAELR